MFHITKICQSSHASLVGISKKYDIMTVVILLKRDYTYYIAIFYFLLDQLTKALVTRSFSLGETKTIIPHFFHLTYLENTGAAWGILQRNTWLLVLFGGVAFFLLNQELSKKKTLSKVETIGFGLLLAGILGNLIDRLLRDCVIDFLDFHFFGIYFPVFNLADIGIVVGVILLLIVFFQEGRGRKEKKHAHR